MDSCTQDMKLIVEIPEDLHLKLKQKALDNRITLRDMITPVLEKLVK